MRALIKNGLVIDPINGIKEKLDVLIENNNILSVKKNINEEVNHVIEAKGMIVSPGFVDLHPNFCDPGQTAREDLKSGSLSAAKGGYTHVVLGTENKPAPTESNVIDYIEKYSNIMPINLYPSAAVTLDRMGYEIADISFLHNHGAVAYYDGLKPIDDKNLLEKILLQIKKFNGILSIYSEKDFDDTTHGIVEGNIAKKLAIKNPIELSAEADDLADNLAMAKLCGVKLDLAAISSQASISLVEKAKKEKQEVFAEVPALNLILNEKSIDKLSNQAKVIPPLRAESERIALCKALKSGIIDAIISNHVPVEEEDKELKFKDAVCGSIGLETVLGICGKALVDDGYLNWTEVISKISSNPAKLYGLDSTGAGSITEGKRANITIFAPSEKWKLSEETIVSKSHNTPLIGVELIGKVKYTICNGKLVYRDVSLVNNEVKKK